MWGKNNHILSCRYTEWNAVATWIAAQMCSLRCLAEMAEPSSQRKREGRSHVTGVLKANSSHDEMRRNQTVRLWPTLDSVYWSFSPSWTQFRDNKKPRLPSFTQQTHVNGSNCGVKCGRVDPPALTAAAAAAQHHFSSPGLFVLSARVKKCFLLCLKMKVFHATAGLVVWFVVLGEFVFFSPLLRSYCWTKRCKREQPAVGLVVRCKNCRCVTGPGRLTVLAKTSQKGLRSPPRSAR